MRRKIHQRELEAAIRRYELHHDQNAHTKQSFADTGTFRSWSPMKFRAPRSAPGIGRRKRSSRKIGSSKAGMAFVPFSAACLYVAAEYRWEVMPFVDFTFFLDAGKVFADKSDFSFDSMQYRLRLRHPHPRTGRNGPSNGFREQH